MESNPSFEDAAIKDTFNDLFYLKLQPLIAEKKYAEARREVKRELRLLAEALGGPINERLEAINGEFEAFLPEDVRSLLETETPKEEREEVVYTESENELIARMAEEGWKRAKFITDTDTASAKYAPEEPGKELFAVSQGERKFIFERDRK